jgi:hypothetical protein
MNEETKAAIRWRLIEASAPALARWLRSADGLLAAWRRIAREGDMEHEALDAFVRRWNAEHAASKMLRAANSRR